MYWQEYLFEALRQFENGAGRVRIPNSIFKTESKLVWYFYSLKQQKILKKRRAGCGVAQILDFFRDIPHPIVAIVLVDSSISFKTMAQLEWFLA